MKAKVNTYGASYTKQTAVAIVLSDGEYKHRTFKTKPVLNGVYEGHLAGQPIVRVVSRVSNKGPYLEEVVDTSEMEFVIDEPK